MSSEMKIAKEEGISCIVDGGHSDMGRDINFLKKISANSGLPIVARRILYPALLPEGISTMSEDQIFQALVKQTQDDPIGVFGEIGSWTTSRGRTKSFPGDWPRAGCYQSLDLYPHRHTGQVGHGAARHPGRSGRGSQARGDRSCGQSCGQNGRGPEGPVQTRRIHRL